MIVLFLSVAFYDPHLVKLNFVCEVHLYATAANISSRITHLGSGKAPVLLLQSTANLKPKARLIKQF